MLPLEYKGLDRNDNEGINLGKFPALNWTSDYFTNWLTQNAVNIAVDTIGNIVGGATNLIKGNAEGFIGNVVDALNTGADIYKNSLVPPQTKGNLNNGDVITVSNKNDFFFYQMTITEEYAKIIDNFFSMFGYKVNELKVPNINSRSNWNYIKTIDCNIIGNIPQEDLQEIKNMFDTGITLWHKTNYFLDYSQENTIVGGD